MHDCIRDLSKHLGIISDNKKKELDKNWEILDPSEGNPVYGSKPHYLKFGFSNNLMVCN
jgi:hypothetical protein